jgi:hypothetical protein
MPFDLFPIQLFYILTIFEKRPVVKSIKRKCAAFPGPAKCGGGFAWE